MKVGILGSGVVGKTLANGFEKYGYDVMIGSRSPEKFNDWSSDQGKVDAIAGIESRGDRGTRKVRS